MGTTRHHGPPGQRHREGNVTLVISACISSQTNAAQTGVPLSTSEGLTTARRTHKLHLNPPKHPPKAQRPHRPPLNRASTRCLAAEKSREKLKHVSCLPLLSELCPGADGSVSRNMLLNKWRKSPASQKPPLASSQERREEARDMEARKARGDPSHQHRLRPLPKGQKERWRAPASDDGRGTPTGPEAAPGLPTPESQKQ